MSFDFNAELHARPSIYFAGPALVEHIALMPEQSGWLPPGQRRADDEASAKARTQVEHHTEFVTVTRVTPMDEDVEHWPSSTLSVAEAERRAGVVSARLVCRLAVLVLSGVPDDLGPVLSKFGFGVTAASKIGAGDAQVCSDFRVGPDQTSRLIIFNSELNTYRLGRMVRRVHEIETYRAMALLGLPEARRLAPVLSEYDSELIALANRNLAVSAADHRDILEDISHLSARIISAAAETRNRFGATSAYAKIVEERIVELRESHVPGFQRFGVFVARRFRPAVRTCEATALRLEQLSHAATHLINLLQIRIQVEVESQNSAQIQSLAERTAVQIRIQRAVEGLSIIAISYYVLSLLKLSIQTVEYSGYHVNPKIMLMSIPFVVGAVSLAIFRIRKIVGAVE